MHDLTRWEGTAYHVRSGFEHDRRATLLDIYKYETEELGNDMPVYGDALALYAYVPARKCIWVTACRVDAMRYADGDLSNIIKLNLSGIVVCDDDQGGYLVIEGA